MKNDVITARPHFKPDALGHSSSVYTRHDDDPRRAWFELGLSFGRAARERRRRRKRR